MFWENTAWKLPLHFHGILTAHGNPLNGEFIIAHEKFLTTLITFSCIVFLWSMKFDSLLISWDNWLLLQPMKIPLIVHLPKATKQPLFQPFWYLNNLSDLRLLILIQTLPKWKITVKTWRMLTGNLLQTRKRSTLPSPLGTNSLLIHLLMIDMPLWGQ